MPTTSRLRAALAAAAVVLLPLLALAAPGTAGATPQVAASPTPCSPLTDPTCLGPKPTASPTPSEVPTASPTPSPTPTRSATPSPAPRRTSSPRPRSTAPVSSGSTENPVTGSVDIGGVVGPSESPTTSPDTKDTSGTSRSGDHLTRLLLLVIGGAVLLGISGATGLYLTRHHG